MNPGTPFRPAFLTDKRGLGGGETSLLNLLSALQRAGVRPVFYCAEGELFDEAARLELEVHPMEYPDVHIRAGIVPTFSLATVIRIIGCFRREGIAVVHAESLLGVYYGGFAARLTGKPLVATYHGYWPLDSCMNRLFLRWFCRRVYPVSRAVQCQLNPVFNGRGGRVRTMPLGVSPAFLEPLPPRDEARRRLGLPPDRPLVLHVARFQSIKGHHHLLEALALMVKEMGERAPLILFAGGVLEPPSEEVLEYKARIERRASLPDIRAHVRFLGHRREVPLLMRAADLLVSPSEFESFGMTLIEAMAVGTPVLATNPGGPSEILDPGKTGWLVPPGNPPALAAAIREILAHPNRTARMAAAGREAALSRYGPDLRAASLIREYEELLGDLKIPGN
jgi:glycosyltransferase involved in cell wall biosynthesis